MTEEDRFAPVFESWLHDTDVPAPDAGHSVRQVKAWLPRTRQLGRWRWLPSIQHRAITPPGTDYATDHRPTLIPATNGHTPTVIGRTQFMFSPARSLIVGAIVFALGGVMLTAQPFDRQGGSMPGAVTDAEVAAPVEFSGRIAFGPCTGTAEYESVDGRVRTLSASSGRFCEPPVVEPFSDARLQGDYYVWQNNDMHLGGPTIWATAFSIVTDEGAWRGIPDVFLDEAASGDQVLVGEGAYEGLTAIATVDINGDVWDWHGWIIDGGLPPLPEEPASIP